MLSSQFYRQIQTRAFAAAMAAAALLITPALTQRSDTIEPQGSPAGENQQADGQGIAIEPNKMGVTSSIIDPNDDTTIPLRSPIAENNAAPPAKLSNARSLSADQSRARAISDRQAINPQCSEIVARAQSGELLSDENRALLETCQ